MLRLILAMLAFTAMLSAEEPTYASLNGDTRLRTPLENLMAGVEWDLFFREFEISYEVELCGSGLDLAIGFRAHLIEPIGFFETTRQRFNFLFAGISVGDGDPFENGTSRIEDGNTKMFSHFIMFPIFKEIFDKELRGIFCFDQSEFSIQYLGELDLSQDEFLMLKMAVEMVSFFTPQAVASSIFDCLATTTANQLDRPSMYESIIRNAMYYNVGCIGPVPLGWSSVFGDDPLAAAMAQSARVFNNLHKIGIFKKQTNWSPGADSMCEPKRSPGWIETQFKHELIYPTVGKSTEFGATPPEWTNFKNVDGSLDEVVFLMWLRRDYVAFAYECGYGD